MQANVLSSGIHLSSIPQSYIRPESDRPRLSQVSPCVDVPYRPLNVQEVDQACKSYGFVQDIIHRMKKMSEVAYKFFWLAVEEKMKLYSEDPSKTVRLSTSFNVNKKKVHSWRDCLRLPCDPPSFKKVLLHPIKNIIHFQPRSLYTSFKYFHPSKKVRLSTSFKVNKKKVHTSNVKYELEDIWSEIAKFLDGKSLVKLAATSRWFRQIIMDDFIWKLVSLRDLQVPVPPPPSRVAYGWSKLYTSAFDGSHSFMFHQQEKHTHWMRIGAFSLDSSLALLTDTLSFTREIRKEETKENMLQSHGCCMLDNVKSGIWIAGTIQILDARHIELFLCEGYQNGSWEYQLIGSRDKTRADGAAGAIFDFTHLKDSSTSAVFDYPSWIGEQNDGQPKSKIAPHAVAVKRNLQDNKGLQVKYHTMTAGSDGEVVAIRISQQLY